MREEKKGEERKMPLGFGNPESAATPCPPPGDGFALAHSVLHQQQTPTAGLQNKLTKEVLNCRYASLWAHGKARRGPNTLRDQRRDRKFK